MNKQVSYMTLIGVHSTMHIVRVCVCVCVCVFCVPVYNGSSLVQNCEFDSHLGLAVVTLSKSPLLQYT